MTKELHYELIAKARTWPRWLLYAKTVWAEARGETREGRIAVCHVMHRRETDSLLWNDILDPWQFSCYNYGDPNFSQMMTVGINDRIFQECIEIAFGVIHGTIPDPTGGANHYFNGRLVRPQWANSMTRTAKIGWHEFYRG